MRAGELMIGDYVIRKNVPKEILIVDTIDSIRGIVYLDLDGLGITEKLENIEPIPLTQKILEKNGWSKDLYDNESYDNDDFEQLSLWEGADGNAWWWHVGIELVVPLNFVHELQHALRLCNISKKIEV